MRYYKNEFSLKTKENDTLESLNTYFKKLGSRQIIIRRPYKRQYKYALIHYSSQGMFVDDIFDMGDTLHCKPFDSIITE